MITFAYGMAFGGVWGRMVIVYTLALLRCDL
jgi:hypothetical protein